MSRSRAGLARSVQVRLARHARAIGVCRPGSGDRTAGWMPNVRRPTGIPPRCMRPKARSRQRGDRVRGGTNVGHGFHPWTAVAYEITGKSRRPAISVRSRFASRTRRPGFSPIGMDGYSSRQLQPLRAEVREPITLRATHARLGLGVGPHGGDKSNRANVPWRTAGEQARRQRRRKLPRAWSGGMG